MSAPVVAVRADVVTCEDLIALIREWVRVTDTVERTKFSGFVLGYASTFEDTEKEGQANDDSSRE